MYLLIGVILCLSGDLSLFWTHKNKLYMFKLVKSQDILMFSPTTWFWCCHFELLHTYFVVFQAEWSSVFSQNPARHFWGEQLKPKIIHLKPAGLCFHLPPGSVWSPPLQFSPCCGCPVINDRITRDHQQNTGRVHFSVCAPARSLF